jgi:perosamine synthetase
MTKPTPIRIPVSAPDISAREEELVASAVRSSWISSTGEFVDRFEREFADRCGVPHALSVCNGTAALHLALLGLGIGPGDEVIVPSQSYVATANSVLYTGATPVFADVDRATWTLDPAPVADVVSERTRAVIAVHLYGQPADTDALREVTRDRGVWIVEDAAEAHFATLRGRPVGSLGDVATFSFYGNKILTCGEGGAVCCSDPDLAARMRLLRGQGMDPQRRFYFPVVGYNYRLTNVACAMLCAQLERYPEILAERERIYGRYDAALADIPGVGLQRPAPGRTVAPWLYSVTLDPEYGWNRDAVMAALRADGIDSRPFFIPNHQLPAFVALPSSDDARLPHTIWLGANGISLPTFSGLRDDQIDEIVAVMCGARR